MRRFRAGGMVDPTEHVWVDRPMLPHVVEAVASGEVIWVWGPPRSGKTNLMARMLTELTRREGVYGVSLSLPEAGNVEPQTLLESLRSQLRLRPMEDRDFWGPVEFRRELNAIGSEVTTALRPVVVVDEVNRLSSIAQRDADDILAALVELADQRRWGVALCGTRAWPELVSSERLKRRLEQARTFDVGHFDEDAKPLFVDVMAGDVQQIETNHAALEDAAAWVDEVWGWTDGHPYYTQRLLSLLQKRLGEGLTKSVDLTRSELVREVASSVIEDEGKDPQKGTMLTTEQEVSRLLDAPRVELLSHYLLVLPSDSFGDSAVGILPPDIVASSTIVEQRLVSSSLARRDDDGLAPPCRLIRHAWSPAWAHRKFEETRPAWGRVFADWLLKGDGYLPTRRARDEMILALRDATDLTALEQRFRFVLVEHQTLDAEEEARASEERARIAEIEAQMSVERVNSLLASKASERRIRWLVLIAGLLTLLLMSVSLLLAFLTHVDGLVAEGIADRLRSESEFCSRLLSTEGAGHDLEKLARDVCRESLRKRRVYAASIAQLMNIEPPPSCGDGGNASRCMSEVKGLIEARVSEIHSNREQVRRAATRIGIDCEGSGCGSSINGWLDGVIERQLAVGGGGCQGLGIECIVRVAQARSGALATVEESLGVASCWDSDCGDRAARAAEGAFDLVRGVSREVDYDIQGNYTNCNSQWNSGCWSGLVDAVAPRRELTGVSAKLASALSGLASVASDVGYTLQGGCVSQWEESCRIGLLDATASQSELTNASIQRDEALSGLVSVASDVGYTLEDGCATDWDQSCESGLLSATASQSELTNVSSQLAAARSGLASVASDVGSSLNDGCATRWDQSCESGLLSATASQSELTNALNQLAAARSALASVASDVGYVWESACATQWDQSCEGGLLTATASQSELTNVSHQRDRLRDIVANALEARSVSFPDACKADWDTNCPSTIP